jgi:phosphopantothenoylcysteine decarboxylase/phosphopantothenate--cysteine ligase
MWNHPLTRANLQRLTDVARYRVVGPGDGFLACRWTGPGRLAEPEDIAEAAATVLSTQDLAGKKFVVSAGPTYEAIDPVRFVGNRSSGKMGIALAAAAKRRGAEVTLILGPSSVPPPIGVTTSHVETAAQLQWALNSAAKGADAIIMTAAVADYRPAIVAEEKLKRGALGPKTSLNLIANPDLLAELGKSRKGKAPLLVGFAAETEDVINNAFKKLESKKVDLIVANDVSEPNSGFAVDTNHVQLVDGTGEVIEIPPAPKSEVAHRILDKISEMFGSSAVKAATPRFAAARAAAKAKKKRK